ncbi:MULTISPECIES: hypothetical protein [unclassified Rhodanobacter]|uniref:hypothetical protein n=1 Tax=unclassified Rhodanobacter TaxID=2621553 RepID=UPI001290844F|nr:MULTISPECIES: hypothetical protein [unclassified Rhodanobacter]
MSDSIYRKLVPVFWVVYILVVPISTGIFNYRYLPNESYDEGKDVLLKSHTEETNDYGGWVEVPDQWQDTHSGIIYTAADFRNHQKIEKKRIAQNAFNYGIIGCLFYACDRKFFAKSEFLHVLRKAIVINFLIAILLYCIT